MNPRRRLLASALAAPLVLAGCKVRTINYFPVKPAFVRFVNVMLDDVVLEVIEGDTIYWTDVGFEGSTDFVEFANEQKTFRVRPVGTTEDYLSVTLALAGEQPYTLAAFGTAANGAVLLLPDARISGSGNVQFRLINLSFGGSSTDLYITEPGVEIDDQVSPNLVGVSAGSSTVSLRFAPGAWRIRATPNGSQTVVYDSGALDFPADTSTDLLIYTLGSASLFQMMILDVDGAGRRMVVPNALTAVKLVNAAVQTGAINAFYDGTKFVSDAAYPAASSYAFLPQGAHGLTVEAASVPGATIASVSRTFEPATDVSVLVVGLPGALQAIVLEDDNRSPVSGKTHVRFVNASSDAAAYDVYVGDARQVAGLAARTASGYFELDNGTYTVTFREPGSGAVVLTIAEADLGEGNVTTFYLTGVAGQLSSIRSTDR